MSARDRVRGFRAVGLLGAAVAAWCINADAQTGRAGAKPKTAATAGAKPAAGDEAIVIKEVRTLVNPNDPIALINGKAITRQRLADECVARRGKEVLETLIAREIIDQAIAQKKLTITPAEIDAEIERVARTVAHVTKEQWLATLDKEKSISPSQYARDIIYPSLALRKLTAPLVKVTDEEINEALESYYGEKLRCRIIMFNSINVAKQTWEDLKRNPGAWDKLVAERSIDQATRSVGGLLTEPIARHAYPRNVSDAAFRELVDIDPKIRADDPAEREKYRPKDGDFTGIIQVTEGSWVILKRESIEPAKTFDKADKALVAQFRETIFEAKLQEQVGLVYGDMLRSAAVENRLTGELKMANEEQHPDHRVDGDVRRMSNPDSAMESLKGGAATGNRTAEPTGRAKLAPPPGVDPKDLQAADKIRKTSEKAQPKQK